jgi:hypothetical protein
MMSREAEKHQDCWIFKGLHLPRCDDGKDPEKRAWIHSKGPEFVYISGRKRAKGEMNGKSGNVNNICSQLYPDRLNIPGNEILCIFDADQVLLTLPPSFLPSVRTHRAFSKSSSAFPATR